MTEWTERHAAQLKGLLMGTPLIENLNAQQPSLGGETNEDTLLRARDRNGWEMCVKAIEELAASRTLAREVKGPYLEGTEKI